jgi:uncharacterized repeat protein (TIGR01451 family)/LPXTG-motif cell wall-anchored protein
MYIHNGAAPGLNGDNFNGPGVARNARIQVYLPTATSTQLRSYSYIIADNTNPGWVADSVDFNSSVPVKMEYVPGSARLANRAHPNGVQLPDTIVNHNNQFNVNAPAAPIGYEQMDGNYPGCFQYDAFVTIKVRINGPGLSINKQVTTPGSTNWGKNLDLTINDPSQTPTVSWLLEYKNTSNVMVTNGVVRDTLPANLKLVPGSVMHFDGNHPQGIPVADNGLFEGGVGVGNIAPGSNGYFRFRTTVTSPFSAQQCGNQRILNVAEVEASGVAKVTDNASVTVIKNTNCKKPSGLICKNLSVTLSPANGVLPNKPTFTGSAEKTGDGEVNPSKYEYHIFKIEGGVVKPMPHSPVVSESTELTNTVQSAYTFTEEGTYRVELRVFDKDGKQVQSDPACNQNFTLSKISPPTPQCLPGIPVGDARCNPVVPPTVPPTTPTSGSLPQTGVETGLLGVIGSSAITIGALKLRRSKKAVAEALLNRS